MAHELSTQNGVVEAMYANKPAWHNLGEVFNLGGTQAPDSATAIKLSHLDWPVEIQKLYLSAELGNAPIEVEGHFATVRMDTKQTLGIVGGRYAVQQNVDCFTFMDSLCQDGIIRYESAFAIRGGRQIAWLSNFR